MDVRTVLLVLLVYGLSLPMLASLGALATVREAVPAGSSADLIVVLGGETTERAGEAARLFNAGRGRRVLVSGAGDCARNRAVLEHAGVPAEAIVLDCAASSTWENVRAIQAALGPARGARVTVVTSWYHVARAALCVRALLPGVAVRFAPVSMRDEPPAQWSTLDRFASEYAKTAWLLAAAPVREAAGALAGPARASVARAPAPGRGA